MTTFPVANYWSDAGRTEAEQKQFGEDFLAATKELIGASAAPPTYTIASGSITPAITPFSVETESGAATDDLTNIVQTNFPDGRVILLRPINGSHAVVVKNSAGGAGQIVTADSADITLNDATTWLALYRNGTSWVELGRWYGNAKAAHRAFYGTAGLSQNAFTGRQEWKQGANLASASTLTLGTDGNSFHVTGTTTINGLSSVQAGAGVRLIFDGVLTLTYNATSLILADGRDYKTRPGDVLEFHSEGSGNWRQAAPKARTPRVAGFTVDFYGVIGGVMVGNDPAQLAFDGGVNWEISGSAKSLLTTTPRGVFRFETGTVYMRGPYEERDLVTLLAAGSTADGSSLTIAMAPRTSSAGTGRFGFVNRVDGATTNLTGNPNEGVFFRFVYNSGNFIAVCRNGGSESGSTVDTGIAVAVGTFHTFRIDLASGVARFYIDDVLVATISTNVPTVAMSIALGGGGGSGYDLDLVDVKTGGR